MNLELIGRIPFSELERQLRQVTLIKKDKGDPDVRVYEEARIAFREVHLDDLNLSTFYVVKEGMNLQRRLMNWLRKEHDIDVFNLPYALRLQNEEGGVWTLTPPIVEVGQTHVQFVPQEGEQEFSEAVELQVPILIDGAHRAMLARQEGKKVMKVIYIAGIDPTHHFYAHPNPWGMVSEVDEVPPHALEKKMYRREDSYALYRDFSGLDIGAPRNVGAKG